jgi:NitT/TauT family transport system permease protein
MAGLHDMISPLPKYPALFATAAVCFALGFIFVAGVLSLSWLSLRKWHDSYDRADT